MTGLRSTPPSYISPTQAAAIAGVTAATVRHWADDGALAARKMPGSCLRVAVKDLEWFLARRADRQATQWADYQEKQQRALKGLPPVTKRKNGVGGPKLDLTALTVAGVAPSYVSVDIAAQLMSVSDKTVRRWIEGGHLRARRMPAGTLRIAVSDLENFGEPVGVPVTGRGQAAA